MTSTTRPLHECIDDIMGYITEDIVKAVESTNQKVDWEGMTEGARLMRLALEIGRWGEPRQVEPRSALPANLPRA